MVTQFNTRTQYYFKEYVIMWQHLREATGFCFDSGLYNTSNSEHKHSFVGDLKVESDLQKKKKLFLLFY